MSDGAVIAWIHLCDPMRRRPLARTAHSPVSTPSSPDARPDPLETLTLGRVAELLSCSDRHVFNLVTSGQLPSLRIGTARGLRVRRRDLEAYLDRHAGYHVDPKHSEAMKRCWRERAATKRTKSARRAG